MKIALCAGGDWANVGYEYAEALKAVGIDAQLLKLREHSFNYQPTGKVVSIETMKDVILESNILIMMHSDVKMFGALQGDNVLLVFKRLGGKIIAFHGGTAYRHKSEEYHKDYNWLIDATIIQTYDLLNKGAKNEHWILPPVDLERIQPDYNFSNKDKLVLGHFPSGLKWKNTVLINKTVKSLGQSKIKYLHSAERIGNHDNLLRMGECDIYIEHQQYMQKDKIYGEFGVACLEAAALGKVVVTCTNSFKEYKKQYGKILPLVISNSPGQLEKVLKELIWTPRSALFELRKKHRKWVETCHSYKAIGYRLKVLCESLF